MRELHAVELRVVVPELVAAELEQVKRQDPEALSKLVVYAVTRRAIFEHLAAQGAARAEVDGRST